MKTVLLPLGVLILLLGTVGAGWLHGRLSNRWGPQPDSHLAARRLLDPLPPQVGHWKLRRTTELEEPVVRLLQCPAYVSRVYDHEQTGDVISVAVLMGPPGPISVHTPEICYSSHDYTVTQDRDKFALQDASGTNHTFWEVAMKSNAVDGSKLRVLYGWTTGESWVAAEYPRFGYGGVPHLYKLQLASTTSSGQSLQDFDPGKDFLAGFLVQLQSHLVASTARPNEIP